MVSSFFYLMKYVDTAFYYYFVTPVLGLCNTAMYDVFVQCRLILWLKKLNVGRLQMTWCRFYFYIMVFLLIAASSICSCIPVIEA